MKKTTVFLSLVVASLMVISCKKTTTPAPAATTPTPAPLSVNSTPQVSYKLNGTSSTYVSNGSGIESASSVQNSASTTQGIPGHEIFGADIDNGNNITYLNINIGTLVYPYGYARPDSATFKNFITTGAKVYSVNAANGIEVSLYDASGTSWSTSAGDQTGSTFNIDAVQQQYILGEQYMKFKASFSCKLYDPSGNVKTLTNGVYIGYFDNM